MRVTASLLGAALAATIASAARAQTDDHAIDAWQPFDQPPPVEQPSDRRFSAKFSAGAAVRGLFTQPMSGVDVEVALGAKLSRRDFFVYGTMGYLRAETFAGLAVHRPVLGAMFEWELDRWHLGIGPQLSLVMVERITRDELMWAFGIGAEGLVSLDLYRGDDGDGLFLGLRAGAAYQFPAAFYGSTLNLGYRL